MACLDPLTINCGRDLEARGDVDRRVAFGASREEVSDERMAIVSLGSLISEGME